MSNDCVDDALHIRTARGRLRLLLPKGRRPISLTPSRAFLKVSNDLRRDGGIALPQSERGRSVVGSSRSLADPDVAAR